MIEEIIIYEEEGQAVEVRLDAEHETIWLSQAQMAELFDKDSDTIGLHLKNIYKDKELEEIATTEKSSVVRKEGKRQVKRKINFYNLDAIISVGYRVNSKRAVHFRQWATRILRDHLVRGYTLNEKRLKEQNSRLNDLRNTVILLEKTLNHQAVGEDEARGLLKVISDYTYALTTLDRYDHGTLTVEGTTPPTSFILEYEEAMDIVLSMKTDFDGLFGMEKDQGFKSAIGAIYQTFDGKDVYPSIEEKAANLLYFVVKDHAFSDGNKRIAAAVFIYFMAGHNILYRSDGSKRIADNALVALTLLIAESNPVEKETIVKVIINLINSSIR